MENKTIYVIVDFFTSLRGDDNEETRYMTFSLERAEEHMKTIPLTGRTYTRCLVEADLDCAFNGLQNCKIIRSRSIDN